MTDDKRGLGKALEIFSRASELEGSTRSAYLEGACGGDASLRGEIESMLIARAEQGEFLDSPSEAVDVTRMSPPPAAVGGAIGPYKILQQIGEGGFGVVYMAEQVEPVRRKVALKIIKLGMDTEQVIARFEMERQALAMMDHPSIATVLDAGQTESGRPYFVMELVRGEPITEYCDKNNLNIRDRLDLFRTVCNAVQHAHQKGIIHRDIKPSNVMVTMHDGKPVPKVIDFGIAKATNARLTEKTVFTEYRQFIGTPEYMSPEQAEMSGLDIDTRADVYSLGVLLYELLTGVTPFDAKELRSAAFGEIQRIIREQTPPRPSTRLSTMETLPAVAAHRKAEPKKLSLLVRGDLDWIVMKALEKDRTRRYDTATSLSEDIGRFLSDEAVLATPPSRTYKLMKLIRRNKGPVAAAAIIVVLLVGGVTGTTQGMISAIRANRALDISLQEELEQRKRAEQARDETQAVVEFLSDMLAAADPAEQGRDVRVREVLDQAARRVGTEFTDQPLVEARLRHTMANTYRALGLDNDAEAQIQRAEQLRGDEQGAHHPDTLESQVLHAMIRWGQGEYDAAARMFEEAIAAQRRVLGDEHPDTLVSEALRADALVGLGRWVEAETVLRSVLENQEEVLGGEDRRTLATRSKLGFVQARRSLFDEAEALLRPTLEAQEQSLGSEHPDTLATRHRLGELLLEEERYSDAEPVLRTAVEVKRRILGEDHPGTLSARGDLLVAWRGLRRFEVARTELASLTVARQRVSGADHPDTIALTIERGLQLRDEGKLDEAMDVFDAALPVLRHSIGAEHPSTLISLIQIADAYRRHSRNDLAIPLAEETLESTRRILGEEHRWTLKAMWILGVSYSHDGRFDDAEPILVELLEKRTRIFGEDSPATVHAIGNLGVLRLDQGRKQEAVELFRRTTEAFRRILGNDDPRTFGHMRALAVSLYELGEYDESARLYAELLEGQRQLHGPDHRETLTSMSGFGQLHYLRGDLEEAERIWRDTYERRVRVLGQYNTETAGSLRRLSELYVESGRLDDARALQRTFFSGEPSGPAEENELAWMLLTARPADMQDPPRALRLARSLNHETGYESAHYLDTLAAALFRVGDTVTAITYQKQALEKAPVDVRENYRERLAEYEAAQPGGG